MTTKKSTIENFLNEEYSQSALYQSFRSIANYIDGLKPSSRKVIYTIKKNNVNTDTKVSRLASYVAGETEYLHGEGSLQGVIVGLAQDFVGSNNDNLLVPSGNFGTRYVPTASAARYIFTRKSESFDKYFYSDDDSILIKQEFEGSKIEPRFFVPTLPLLLINGSEGIGTGFAQKILPRNPEDIKKYIMKRINGERTKVVMNPWYKGFNGTIEQDSETQSWIFSGKMTIKNSNTIEITELPPGYTLSSYNSILAKLEEKKIIKEYEDLSEDDKFHFIISVRREFIQENTEKDILEILKLQKRVSENFTCVDENNSIIEFSSVNEIIDAYIKIRLLYYEKRKKYLLSKYDDELSILESKALFIEKVINGEIKINNKPKQDIEKQIKKFELIIKVNDSYEYLLKMPIYSLTLEKFEELKQKAKDKKKEIMLLKKQTNEDLWVSDLNKIS